MNQKNNHLDYTLKVWLSISVLAPTLSALADLVIDNSSLELIVVGVLFFTIFFATTVSLPFYFLLKKISKIVYEFNLPNQQVRLLLTLVVFFFIFATHILFYHKTLNQVSSLESGINYYIKFFFLSIQLAKYYLLPAVVSIWYFKIERETYLPKNKSDPEILDDNLDF